MKLRTASRSMCVSLQWLVLLGGMMCVMMVTAVAQQSPVIRYFYDDLGRLIKVIDLNGNVAEYVYDAVGNILEIRRSTLTDLAILHFTPAQGPVGTHVTISGQGFSTVISDNAVTFNGIAALVQAATATSLVVTVLPGATTGPIAVAAAGNTATSDSNFTVLQVPVIASVSPRFGLPGTTIPSFQVQGVNLTDASFAFLPALVPQPIAVDARSIDPSGTAATLSLTIAGTATGPFALVATTATGSSDAFPSPANTLHIVSAAVDSDGDGLTNAQELTLGTHPFILDTDGDGFIDGLEAILHSNPLDAGDVPNVTLSDVVGRPLVIQNRTDPSQPLPSNHASSLPFTVVNALAPSQDSDHDGFSDVVELSAGTNPLDPTSIPNIPLPLYMAEGPPLAIVNTTNPSQPLPGGHVSSLPFTVMNALTPSQDSDHDGFSDVVELSAGTDPLDPTSIPNIPPPLYMAEGPPLAIVNTTNPSQPLSVNEAVGQVLSVNNLP